jgi:exopolyphosphatase/guanosine-5'-triphosphate,3'-diphosphate pyrophosphatase
MAGFPRAEQQLLSIMVGSHRRRPAIEEADELTHPWDKRAPAITLLLRLAVLLHRGRSTVPLPPIQMAGRADALEMRFPAGWLDDHPLTAADLKQEAEQLKTVGFRLKVRSA